MKLHVIHFETNADLPEAVRAKVPDEVGQTILRYALNQAVVEGKSEMHAYIKAYQALSAAGYHANEEKVWVTKDSPTVGEVHVPRPLGLVKPKRQGKKDDPGTQDVDPQEQDGHGSDFAGTTAQTEEDDKQHEQNTPESKDDPGTQDVLVGKRISGNSPIHLNAKGAELADKLGERIHLKGGLDVCYCSPLNRAKETRDKIAEHNPDMFLAKPDDALRPWRLGAIEGRQPKDVKDLVRFYIEHPDELPPGNGADGKPGETFRQGAMRQIKFLRGLYNECDTHPDMKVGVVMHSRGMELITAYNDAGMPDKIEDLSFSDLYDPEDPAHADMLRWHNEKIKDVDLEDDEELKPGLNLILHSLTDDDGDEGNPELQKKMLRPPHLRASTGAQRCANCSYFDPAGACKMYGNFPVQADQVCDKWVAKQVQKYLAPIEMHRAAVAAYEVGMSVLDITAPLVEQEGLAEAEVRKIAEHFAAPESATESEGSRCAWGGPHAKKWADRVLKRIEKESAGQWAPWTGVDLDRTLAEPSESYDGTAIGKPKPDMVRRVQDMLAEGLSVKIFTARVADDPDGKKAAAIKAWCKANIGRELPVTNEKDPGCVKIIDDIAESPTNKADSDELVLKAGNGVMLAFMLQPDIAHALALPGGEEQDQLHLTLAYFGSLSGIPAEKIAAIEQAVQQFAQNHGSLSGTLGGPMRFAATPSSDAKDVVVATFECPQIQDFRRDLVSAVSAAGADPKTNFGYVPHVTLAYIDPKAGLPIQRIDPIPVEFGAISLCIGGARKTYMLEGQPQEQFEIQGNIVKMDAERHLVFGWFSIIAVGGRPVLDTQQDVIPIPTLEDAAYNFVLTSRVAGKMHDRDADGGVVGVGRLVESVIFTEEKVRAMIQSLEDQGIHATIDLGCVGWWGGFHIEDETAWKDITTGELRAFSVAGRGKRAALAAE